MSRNYKFYNSGGLYFVSFAVVDWIDVFTRNEYKDIIVESLDFCQKNKGLELFAWCVMTNHVHLIIRAKEKYVFQDIMRDFKKFTSKEIINAIRSIFGESYIYSNGNSIITYSMYSSVINLLRTLGNNKAEETL